MRRLMRRKVYLFALLCGFSIACSSSSGSGLPSSFGDSASPPCEVALEAFTKDPNTLPHCESSRDAVDLTCPTASAAETGTCEERWVVRYVYGFPGDFWECVYEASAGALVGAKWAPDNHPVQFAGEQLPAGCQLTAVCEEPTR